MPAALPEYKTIESVTLRCALGLRFRDAATNQIVGDGLSVTASPVSAPANAPTITAQVTPSGMWLFYQLPRLRTYELGTADLTEEGSPATAPQFRIQVDDLEGRFLPIELTATASQIGPMQFVLSFQPPWSWTDIPLFSAPSRPIPPACAVVRANLLSAAANSDLAPANGALLQVAFTLRNKTKSALGMANENGDVVIIFPWPEPTALGVSSPPGGQFLEAQGWDLEFAAWLGVESENGDYVNLDATLGRMAGAPDSLATADSPAMPFSNATLVYGSELVVPELPASSPPGSGVSSVFSSRSLIITAAGSPP